MMMEKISSDTGSAYDAIRSRIFDGRLSPGQKISHRGLAHELGVGQMPVRSALQLLASEGLVNIIDKSGTYINEPTRDDLREIYEFRLALESTATYLAAQNGPTERMTRASEQMRRFIDENNADIMTEQKVGWVFHDEIFKAARNDRLWSTYRLLRAQTHALNELPRDDSTTVRRGTREHLEIYIAIHARDAEAARRLMWQHVIDGTPDRIRLIRAQNDHNAQ